MKLNTDGASRGSPGLAGCGGVIRDHERKWVAGFARRLAGATLRWLRLGGWFMILIWPGAWE